VAGFRTPLLQWSARNAELSRRKGAAPNAMPVIFTSTLGFGSLGQETRTFSHFGELVYGISQASQAWMDIQVWEEKGTLTFNWDVVEELFPEGLIEDMFEAYCHFLKQLASSESAWVETTRQLLPPAQLCNGMLLMRLKHLFPRNCYTSYLPRKYKLEEMSLRLFRLSVI
jgi:non-ribosomal peptide synthetase component F